MIIVSQWHKGEPSSDSSQSEASRGLLWTNQRPALWEMSQCHSQTKCNCCRIWAWSSENILLLDILGILEKNWSIRSLISDLYKTYYEFEFFKHFIQPAFTAWNMIWICICMPVMFNMMLMIIWMGSNYKYHIKSDIQFEPGMMYILQTCSESPNKLKFIIW